MDIYLPPLTDFISDSLKIVISPDEVKLAGRIPLFKKADLSTRPNYRPGIVISKVFQKFLEE